MRTYCPVSQGIPRVGHACNGASEGRFEYTGVAGLEFTGCNVSSASSPHARRLSAPLWPPDMGADIFSQNCRRRLATLLPSPAGENIPVFMPRLELTARVLAAPHNDHYKTRLRFISEHSGEFRRQLWPLRSPDMNPTECPRDEVGRSIRNQDPASTNNRRLPYTSLAPHVVCPTRRLPCTFKANDVYPDEDVKASGAFVAHSSACIISFHHEEIRTPVDRDQTTDCHNILRNSGSTIDHARLEQRPNERTGGTGDPRENPPTSGIVQHDSHMKKSGSDPSGIEPGLPWWEASMSFTHPSSPIVQPASRILHCCDTGSRRCSSHWSLPELLVVLPARRTIAPTLDSPRLPSSRPGAPHFHTIAGLDLEAPRGHETRPDASQPSRGQDELRRVYRGQLPRRDAKQPSGFEIKVDKFHRNGSADAPGTEAGGPVGDANGAAVGSPLIEVVGTVSIMPRDVDGTTKWLKCVSFTHPAQLPILPAAFFTARYSQSQISLPLVTSLAARRLSPKLIHSSFKQPQLAAPGAHHTIYTLLPLT
ncbi:hypothetical protein PR048_022770 [Dryococelus australis]|uniref:Uncharacterized protein n=1 Tax=Dryococelus australis TaxID=614101 RepID=A0ABQ9GS74_9NEOP|nr:hypothetical protein PR048_022770 [Dryococelus australis]